MVVRFAELAINMPLLAKPHSDVEHGWREKGPSLWERLADAYRPAARRTLRRLGLRAEREALRLGGPGVMMRSGILPRDGLGRGIGARGGLVLLPSD